MKTLSDFAITQKCRYCGALYDTVFWFFAHEVCHDKACRRRHKLVNALVHGTRRVYSTGGIDQMLTENETDFAGEVTRESLDRVLRSG